MLLANFWFPLTTPLDVSKASRRKISWPLSALSETVFLKKFL